MQKLLTYSDELPTERLMQCCLPIRCVPHCKQEDIRVNDHIFILSSHVHI